MKIKEFTIILSFILFIQVLYSQKRNGKIEYVRNKDKSVTFFYNSILPNSTFIILKFNNLTNTNTTIVKKTVKGFRSQITTLRPIDSEKSIRFSYSYRTFLGNIDKEPDSNFKYILPIKKGNNIKVKYLSYLGKKFGNKEPENWKSFQFLTSLNDTVYAIRKGIVVKVINKYNNDESKEFGYHSKSNSITIEHKDGTLATYKVLKRNSIMVKVGDLVYPSAPIAIAGTYDKAKNSQLRLSIYYLNKKVKDLPYEYFSKTTVGNRIHIHSYVDPFFYTNSGGIIQIERNKEYASNYDDTIIELEMTKRERKRWKKKGLLIK